MEDLQRASLIEESWLFCRALSSRRDLLIHLGLFHVPSCAKVSNESTQGTGLLCGGAYPFQYTAHPGRHGYGDGCYWDIVHPRVLNVLYII